METYIQLSPPYTRMETYKFSLSHPSPGFKPTSPALPLLCQDGNLLFPPFGRMETYKFSLPYPLPGYKPTSPALPLLCQDGNLHVQVQLSLPFARMETYLKAQLSSPFAKMETYIQLSPPYARMETYKFSLPHPSPGFKPTSPALPLLCQDGNLLFPPFGRMETYKFSLPYPLPGYKPTSPALPLLCQDGNLHVQVQLSLPFARMETYLKAQLSSPFTKMETYVQLAQPYARMENLQVLLTPPFARM